ncbi:hypothetical protein ACVWWG_001560 [Bradyrhizobium sp. LB7.2]
MRQRIDAFMGAIQDVVQRWQLQLGKIGPA